MNLPIMDDIENKSVRKEKSTAVSSTTADRVNQLLALSDPETGIERPAPSVVTYNATPTSSLKEGDLWGSWHVNGKHVICSYLPVNV